MTDLPNPTDAIKAPLKGAKGLGGRLKGLPPWAYMAAIGIGGGAIWYGISRSRSAAAADTADTTGTDPNASLTADGSGQVYPDGGLPSGSGFDYSALGDLASANQDANSTAIQDLTALLGNLKDIGVVGGGTPAPSPIINVNVPANAKPTSGPSKVAAKSCPKSFHRHNAKAGPPSPGTCYKCAKAKALTGKSDARYPWRHVYQNGHVVKSKSC